MQGPGGRIVVNPAFEDWVYEDEKPTAVTPVKRQITYHVEEEIGQRNDPWEQCHLQDSYGSGKAVSTHSSSHALLSLVALLCVLSIAAIALNLLMFFGKIDYKCGCTDEQLGKYKGLICFFCF